MTVKSGVLASRSCIMAANEKGDSSPPSTHTTAQTFNHAEVSKVGEVENNIPVVVDEKEKESIMKLMLDRLSVTNAHFAHRQRDAPDLTQQEKFDIGAEILRKSHVQFLARFGKYLQASDLRFFQDVSGDPEKDYEIQFYLKEIAHRCAHSDVIVKNRRFAAMQELEARGVYFSEKEMKQREPLLYQQLIGQYMTEEEQKKQAEKAINRSDLRFSTILLSFMDSAQENMLYRFQKEKEECQEEEEEEEGSEEEDNKKHDKAELDDDDELTEDPPEITAVRATDIWRQQQREEFRAILHEKFLSGCDTEFDYSQVDSNPDYDSLATVSLDEEQKYFLSEEPDKVGDQDTGDSSMDTNEGPCVKMNCEEKNETVDDYMLYEPPPELVAKSAHFVKLGSWNVDQDKDS